MTPEQRATIETQCDTIAKAGTEHAHQRAFFAWLAWTKRLGNFPRADRCFAIPNGGKRDPITAARLKAEGVKAGVPDTFYPVPSLYANAADCEFMRHGLFMEFKKDKGREQANQTDWIAEAIADNYAACTVYSWRAAASAFTCYHNGHNGISMQREYRE